MKLNVRQYGDDNALSPSMLIAAEILSTPGRAGLTMDEIAERANTTERTLRRWRQTPVFMEYVKRRTMDNCIEHLGDVLEALTIKAKRGDSVKAAEVWLRTMGVMTPEFVVRPMQPDEDRTNEALERSIAELQRQLDEQERETPE